MDVTFDALLSQKSDGLTLYQYLDGYFPFIENNNWAQRLVRGLTTVNDVVTHDNPVLIKGQSLRFTVNNYEEDPVDTGWKLLWQNDDLLAIHKPANLPVHRTTRNIYYTLAALVRRDSQWPEAQLLHRLDQETAGIVLFAKNQQKAAHWQPKFKSLLNEKVYQAIVYGRPSWDSIELTNELAVRKNSAIRCQMHVCEGDEKGKISTTQFRVLETFGEYSLIECLLLTGRKHQIRAHLAHLGHPIVGDKIYAHDGEFYLKRLDDAITDNDVRQLKTPHHLLFAQRVKLDLSEVESEYINIENEFFPEAWLSFIRENR